MNGLSTLITFSEEQAMLLEVATSFCRDKSPMSKVRAQLTSEDGFDRALWDEMVSLGWSGIAVPELYGGSALSLAEVATIAEPMGRHLMATPFVSTQLFIQGLLTGGSEQQKLSALGKICKGKIGTVALFERDGDWNIFENEAQGVVSGQSVTLSGAKTLVCDAGVADHFLIAISVAGEPALVLLSSNELSKERRHRELIIDETRRSYRIDLNGLKVAESSVITGASAKAALDAIGNCGLLLASAEASGGIAGALDVIVGYLNLRTTFGRKIGSYQSLKHTSADILIGLERSRSHLYHAASLLAAGEDAEIALRMAKVESSDSFAFAGDRGVQFHGGFGFTYECDAQLYLRRALWLQYSFGDATHHRRRLADRLLVIPA
jgi:acyl-CoA dehydrogenase